MCLANLHGGAAEERGKRMRFHKIGGGRGGRGRTSASSLASSRGEVISIEVTSMSKLVKFIDSFVQFECIRKGAMNI